MKPKGAHPIHRSIFDHWTWGKKPFSPGHALIDLILLANHADKTAWIEGKNVMIKKGQIYRSQVTLAARWGWSRRRVNRYLNRLKSDQTLVHQTVQHGTVITLLNYNKLHDLAFKRVAPNVTPKRPPNVTPSVAHTTMKNNEEQIPKGSDKSQTHEFIKKFCSQYTKITGKEYVVNWGKDGKIIKDLLVSLTFEELTERADGFFRSDDAFIKSAGYTIGVFSSQVNKIPKKKGGGKLIPV